MSLDMDMCWTRQDVCVLDFETLGLLPSDGACDVAVVRFSGGRIVDSFTSLINPMKPIPEGATAIHGIRDEHVLDAPTLPELAPHLLRLADGAVPCAYSSSFDAGFLHAEITGADCAMFDPKFGQWLDPLVVVKDVDRFISGLGRHKLTNACARRGINIFGAHRALPDATATGQLLFTMLQRSEIKACPLGKLLSHIGKRARAQEADFQAWLSKQAARP